VAHHFPAKMSNIVKIGLLQLSCQSDRESNLNKTLNAIRKVYENGAQIVCLQELFATLYFCETEDHNNFSLAESVPGPTTDMLQPIAKELGIVIIASLFEFRAAGVYHNTAAVIDADGTMLGTYRKNHIPDDPGFYEKFYFSPGDLGYKVFDTRFGRIGVLICWDQWFPEAARITSLMGAEIIFYPAAIGWELDSPQQVKDEQYKAWQTIQCSHAIANGVHVVSANRVGREGITNFWGGSFVCNPFGTLLYQASHDKDDIEVIEVDLSQTEKYRSGWPFLRDRRIDTYGPILKRFVD
jgi:N-carbamoylputrescine amidase